MNKEIEPTFITNGDNEPMFYPKDKVFWTVNTDDDCYIEKWNLVKHEDGRVDNFKYFKSEEKATEYSKQNKLRYSNQQLQTLLSEILKHKEEMLTKPNGFTCKAVLIIDIQKCVDNINVK